MRTGSDGSERISCSSCIAGMSPRSRTRRIISSFAFWTATNWETDGDANVYMNNDKIIYGPDYAQGEWGPEDARYWTKTGCITFASYSPYTTGSDNGFSEIPVFTKEKGFVFNNYTVPINGPYR